MAEETKWRTVAEIRKSVKKAGGSVNSWLFLLSAEIAFAVVAILLKTMKLSETALTGGESLFPSLYELSEGKGIDTSQLASAFTKWVTESHMYSDITEAISKIAQSTLQIAAAVFLITLLVLYLKVLKKKGFEAELEKKYSEVKRQGI